MLKRTKSRHAPTHRRQSLSSDILSSTIGDFASDSSSNNSLTSCSPASSFSGNDGQLYWDISLDSDLLQTIVHFYPEWFSDCVMAEANLSSDPMVGSPRAVVDDASIRKAMDKNKESLKVKLLLRRPIGQLVEQGILPPLKASPEFYERSKKLERARMEDYLKRQIQRRPDRQSLIEQHILEDTFVSPSLQGAERQLKKVRLADDLNDRLSHRPGPLELVKGNILLADERLAQAIKEGSIRFKATSEGEPVKHPPPLFHLEDPESSSDGTRSPPQDLSDASLTSYSPLDVHAVDHPVAAGGLLICSAPATTSSSITLSAPTVLQSQPIGIHATLSSFSSSKVTTHSFAATTPVPSSAPAVVATTGDTPSPRPSFTPGSTTTTSKPDSTPLAAKSRKKCKSKVQPKTRTIKFHEYKGPPSAQKSGNASAASSSSESSYELLLKQQQLFLQWQLEWQQKYPHIIMPPNAQKQMQEQSPQDMLSGGTAGSSGSQQQAVLISNSGSKVPVAETTVASMPKNNANQSNNNSNNHQNNNNVSSSNNSAVRKMTSPVPSNQTSSFSASNTKLIARLEDLKVSDLKVQLKKRSLPVSGSKPQLLERLKPFASEVLADLRASASSPPVTDHSDSSKSTDSPSPVAISGAADSQRRGVGGESAAEVITSGEVAMDVGEGLQANSINVSPHFASSDRMTLSSAPRFINNSFIINKDMIKLHPEPVEVQGKGQQAPHYQVPGQQQFQLQFQYPIFQTQGTSIAIPLASIASPQFQVITSMSQNQTPSHLTSTSSRPAPQSQDSHYSHRRKSVNGASPYENPRPSSASVKASLAAFLQSQAAQHQQQNQSLMSEQLVSGDISYPHVVLLPADQSLVTKHHRAHSFSVPADATCHLANRTGSLPSFPIARRLEKSSTTPARPPPPNYEEATKVTTKAAKRQSKKNNKSQALEDVLEILVKSGELPASAADEPQTPTTPSNKSLPGSHSSLQNMFSDPKTETTRPVKEESQVDMSCHHVSDAGMDLDLSMFNLQSLSEPMDYGHDADRNVTSWLMHPPERESQKQSLRQAGQPDQNCDMSLSWMDVSPGDANDWMADMINSDNENNKLSDHKSREVPSNDFSHFVTCPQKNSMSMDRRSLFRPNLSPVTIPSPCSAKDHDPVLPNNMVGTVSCTEPLLDLFFDESDMRAHELGVWDRLDFAA